MFSGEISVLSFRVGCDSKSLKGLWQFNLVCIISEGIEYGEKYNWKQRDYIEIRRLEINASDNCYLRFPHTQLCDNRWHTAWLVQHYSSDITSSGLKIYELFVEDFRRD